MSPSIHVLLIDDDNDDYVIVRSLLSQVKDRKYKLNWVSTYEDALESMMQSNYDVCLMDYRLGAHDGLELLREARARGCKTPMILLTGQGGHKIDVEAMKAGAADYLVKGQIDAAVLERAIRYAIERTKTLETMRKNEERFRGIVEATPIPMVIVKLSDSTILFTNNRFTSFLNLSKDAVINKALNQCIQFDENQAILETVQKKGFIYSQEVHGMRSNCEPFWVNLSAQKISLEEEDVVLVGLNDITEQKRAEQELVRLERLRALGEISAGISHNLNNLLVGVLGPAQALQRRTEDPRLLEMVEDIVISAKRARDLVHRLHQAVTGHAEDPLQPVSLNKVIQDVVRSARPRWKDEPESKGITIKVITDLSEDLPPIKGTKSGLHDIFLNLLFNAVDAMPKGGTITFESTSINNHVQVVVSDTGIGMDEEMQRRVFDPFFTTKVAVGTGLGLYTVYGTIKQLEGEIEVESTLGESTDFILKFPVWADPVQELPTQKHVHASRRGKILIIDDDQLVLKVLPYALSEWHDVETAEGGKQAIEAFATDAYDVVFIDLGMPEMPGDQVVEHIKKIDPNVATVLITGWSIPQSDPRAKNFDFHIQKPFDDLDEVANLISQAIKLRDTRHSEKIEAG